MLALLAMILIACGLAPVPPPDLDAELPACEAIPSRAARGAHDPGLHLSNAPVLGCDVRPSLVGGGPVKEAIPGGVSLGGLMIPIDRLPGLGEHDKACSAPHECGPDNPAIYDIDENGSSVRADPN